MKSFFLLFVLFVVFASCSVFAQEQTHSAGAVPNLKLDRSHTIVSTIHNPATIAYGHSGVQNYTLSMPIPAGTPLTLLSAWTAPSFASSMTKGGDGNYYLTEVSTGLHTFNTETGAVTLLGAITGLQGADQVNGIAFNPANGNYYLAAGSISPVSDNIYLFNVSTRIATLIGSTGTNGLQIDLTITKAGVCYSYDILNNNSYTINLSTGAATLLGPLGFDPNFGQGMSIDNETNTIYLSAFNNDTFSGQLRTLNTSNGSTTLVVDWGFEQIAPFALNTQYGPTSTITVKSPSGGEVWPVGSTQNITWNSTNVLDVKIELSTNNGASWTSIVDSTPSSGIYSWVVPNTPSTQGLIAISDKNNIGVYGISDSLFTIDPVGSTNSETIPEHFALYQNYPNPFNPSTKITYSIPERSSVSLKVFDLLGSEVEELVKGEIESGTYDINFNASNLPSGVYFYRLQAGSFVETKKMLLLK